MRSRPGRRTLGLALAMFTRIGLLLPSTWVMRLTQPLFTIVGRTSPGAISS